MMAKVLGEGFFVHTVAHSNMIRSGTHPMVHSLEMDFCCYYLLVLEICSGESRSRALRSGENIQASEQQSEGRIYSLHFSSERTLAPGVVCIYHQGITGGDPFACDFRGSCSIAN